MKKISSLLLVLVALSFASCKSGVTLEKLTKQEAEAREELQEVQAELIKLADLKEKYSVDNKKAELKKMRGRLDEVGSEISKLKSVTGSENQAVQSSAKEAIAALEKEQNDLKAKIAQVEAQPQENWSTSVEAINLNIKRLEEEVNKIMANVKGDS